MTLSLTQFTPGGVLSNLLLAPGSADSTLHEAIESIVGLAAHDVGAALQMQALAGLPAAGGQALAQLAAQAWPAAAAASDRNAPAGDAAAEQVKSAFEEEFAAKAADKEEFDAFMQEVFGDNYDKDLAEQYRQQALAGDFSWLPDVQFVDADVLGGANGAYNAEDGVVYINRDLAESDPAAAAQTFVEEAGHHLDAMLNATDSQGDEGELFRRTLGGEQLSDQQVAEIRNENDIGTIVVDGRQVQVEFWNPFKAVGDAVKDVANAVGDAVKDVGKAVGDAAKAVGNAAVDAAKAVGNLAVEGAKAGFEIARAGVEAAWDLTRAAATAAWDLTVGAAKAVGKAAGQVLTGVKKGIEAYAQGIWDSVKDVGLGLWQATYGFASNLWRGRIGEAFSQVVAGFDRAVFQATERFQFGLMDGVHEVLNGCIATLGPLGKPLQWATDVAFDISYTVVDTTFTLARTAFRLGPDTAIGFVSDIERSLKLAAKGQWGAAVGQFGMAFVHVATRPAGYVLDVSMVTLQAAGSILQTAVGLEPPGRKLTDAEIDYLKSTYGNSIDYGLIRVKTGGALNNVMAAHTVGNTVYLPPQMPDSNGNLVRVFNADGTLTWAGLHSVLGHEVGHVWQNQNGGPDYIHFALGAQWWSLLTTGSLGGAYSWKTALAAGKTFETMNEEERARAMEDIGIALQNGGKGITQSDGFTAAQVRFLRSVWRDIQRGEGTH